MIPAYNEELNLGQVIREIKAVERNLKIVVIDDGSEDETSKIAQKEGVIVLSHKKNLGSGEAIKTGFKYALKNNYQYMIRLDADGQHNPQEIPRFIKKLLLEEANMMVGSRFLKKTSYQTPIYRLFCIKTIALIYRLFYGFKITDPTSGYRGYDRKTANFLMNHYQESYPEAISIASLLINGFKIKEISSNMRPRFHGKSSIHLVKGFYFFILIVSKIIMERFGKRELS